MLKMRRLLITLVRIFSLYSYFLLRFLKWACLFLSYFLIVTMKVHSFFDINVFLPGDRGINLTPRSSNSLFALKYFLCKRFETVFSFVSTQVARFLNSLWKCDANIRFTHQFCYLKQSKYYFSPWKTNFKETSDTGKKVIRKTFSHHVQRNIRL